MPADDPEGRAIRIGEFEFAEDSGTLSRPADGGSGERMAPKPAALLALLARRRGGLVTRQEIREHLWSDVTVDFDNSLNYCIRQVRQAFGDSAGTPRYIETVPGRGYRLRPALFPAFPPSTEVGQPERRAMSRRSWISVVGIGAAALGVGGWWLARRGRATRLRIAIMPFAHPAMSPELALRCSQLEARVLADLTTRGAGFADVVGPRTTGPLVAEGLPLPRIAATLGADLVVNARFLGDAANAEILFELIRSSDRVHVYVKRVSDLSPVDAVAETIVAGMLAALEVARAGG